MLQKFLMVLIIWAVTAACSPSSVVPTQLPIQLTPTTLSRPTATVYASPTSEAASPLLSYRKSGGIMGMNEQWTLYSDGRLESGKGKIIRVTPKEAQSLRSKLLDQNFISASKAVKTPSGCADCIWITITLYQDGQKYEIQTNLENQDTPENERTIAEGVDTWIQNNANK